jgi:carnitine 3-dehydrogenase
MNVAPLNPIETVTCVVPTAWTDYNQHMNEGRYAMVFSKATDALLTRVGVDDAYIKNGLSYFTVESHIRFLHETDAGTAIVVTSRALEGWGKKFLLYHEMKDSDGRLHAAIETLLVHVNLKTRRACEPPPEILARVRELVTAQGHLPPVESRCLTGPE